MAIATTQSWQEHTSDGSTAYFPFNFNYDTTRPGTIVVGKRTADNTYSVVDASNYELIPNAAGDGGQIRFIQNPSGSQIIDDIPPAGTIIRIERVSVDTSSATWQIGLEMSELVNLFDRLFRLVQENKNNFANVIKTFETQHNISLYELLSEHNNHLLYWDNTTQTLTPTDFPKKDVVRATDGMFLRISTDTAGNPYLEWSLTGTDNWHSVSDTAVEALSKINNHLADKDNPHETAISKLTDVELTNLSTNQFLSFDGSKWKNIDYNTTVTWGGILGNILNQTDLNNTFVHKSGDTMTGPLLMRATESFKCAIAPYWDGVGFFKLNDNDSVTLMASIEYNSGFEPATTNTYNIGASARKWKDLYLAGKAYIPVINNGFDIAVPVTNSADTLALKSQVDLAANSGSQLYTTGVWYAKMYSASTVPTGAEYDGKNYADFSQVDNDNNPIIVIYEGQSGAWVEIERITPPAAYNGYVTITSKIWDIAEQTDQQGGEVLWSYNQKTFTPYPKIINLLNQANTDLSNLTSTGANIGNWSSNVTNCITEIPQDLKIELNNGIFTLKAGSKIYVPNGAGVFDEAVLTVDKTITPSTFATSSNRMIIYRAGSLFVLTTTLPYVYSGATAPTTFDSNGRAFWYDTANNNIKFTDNSGSTWYGDYAFPIAFVHITNGIGVDKIEQAFNGIGYIGKTIFITPGVKFLGSDGRNADGTLKNYVTNPTQVLTVTPNPNNAPCDCVVKGNSVQALSAGVKIIKNTTEITLNVPAWYYSIEDNICGVYDPSSQQWSQTGSCLFGNIVIQNNQITNMQTKQPFRAVDYNEFEDAVKNTFRLPAGTILSYGGSSAPTGYLMCNGQAVSRATYASLFAIIGTNYGVGDGSTTFNLPDYTNRVAQGLGTGYLTAGLPNITGNMFKSDGSGSNNNIGLYPNMTTTSVDGCFEAQTNDTNMGYSSIPSNSSSTIRVSLDASRSSNIYGNSATVQPAAVKTYWIIKY